MGTSMEDDNVIMRISQKTNIEWLLVFSCVHI